MVSFFSENYYIYHYSNSCSLAFIFLVVLIIFSILLPYFTNFGPLEKFWMPNTIFIDHPIVQFDDKFFIQITTDSTTIEFNTNKIIDESQNYLLSSVSFEVQDYSNKDIINIIKFKGQINKLDSNPLQIKDVKFYFFFDYYMTEIVNLHLKSKAHLFYSSNYPFSKIISDNELILKQNEALTETYFIQNDQSEKSLEEEIDEINNGFFFFRKLLYISLF